MKRGILIGTLVLLVQIGLVAFTHWRGPGGQSQVSKGSFLGIQAAMVDTLVLSDGTGHQLRLTKAEGRWRLPDAGNFPANGAKVDNLIGQLAGLQHGWPEATTAEAATRFKVAADRFERKISLQQGATTLATVYVGNASGLRKMYIRADKTPQIQTLAIAAQDLELRTDDWIDTAILHWSPEKVASLELPGLRLQRTPAGLQLADLQPGEEVVKERVTNLVDRVAGLNITGLLGTENKAEYGLDHPVLTCKVVREDGGSSELLFGQMGPKPAATTTPDQEAPALPDGSSSYALKASGQTQLFRVDSWQVEELKKATRASLLRTSGTTGGREAAPGKGPAAMVPASPGPAPTAKPLPGTTAP